MINQVATGEFKGGGALQAHWPEYFAIRVFSKESIEAQDFIDLLIRSKLSERRPIDDMECMQGVCDNSNLIICAYDENKLVGIARSVTDFHYACYLSDLAVDSAYQGKGIGRTLIIHTQTALQSRCKLILLSAPKANDFYEKIGMEHHPRAWTIDRLRQIK